MNQPIVYVDTSTIREGKLGELQVAMKHLAAFVEGNVPQLISYAFYLDAKHTQMTVVAVHPDSASLEFHLDAGREEFEKFAALIQLAKIEVYGVVSAAVLGRLQRKARTLGNATVTVYEFFAGFVRPG
jgi:hypothetical protein